MKTIKLLAAGTLALGLSAPSYAQIPGLDSVLNRLVSSAITATTEELKYQVQEAVLNASHKAEGEAVNAKVEITETSQAKNAEEE